MASISIAKTLADGGGLQQIYNNDDFLTRLDMPLRAALVSGLAETQSPNSLTPTCTSRNCTFPTTDSISYSSLGFSSECIDISSLTTQTGNLT